MLAGKGYNEISTNSITQSIFEQDENLKSEQIRLLNSQTAELDSLRTSLLYDGLNVIAHNCNRKNNHLQLFEFGNTYHKVGNEFNQKKHLAIYLTGEKQQQDWLQPALKTDFFHLKETVMAVFSSKGIHPTAHKISEHAPFSFSLDLYVEDTLIAQIGKVAPAVAKKMDVKQDVFFALINWNLVEGKSTFHQIHFKELNKFPTVSRDLAIVLDEEKTFSEVETIVKEEAKKYLKTIALFDVYRGDKIAANQKSYAINFVLADDTKTLSDTEIDKTTQKIIKKLESSLQATLRK